MSTIVNALDKLAFYSYHCYISGKGLFFQSERNNPQEISIRIRQAGGEVPGRQLPLLCG